VPALFRVPVFALICRIDWLFVAWMGCFGCLLLAAMLGLVG